ncbi:MAG: hypothetical protein A2X86_01715 [Bdellovibrionales bacterium GWA2_49_15]|nr:MAG: hypothetical protein A2X86_01715 [Bdellovibrionales bacterium GWA2_49_15]
MSKLCALFLGFVLSSAMAKTPAPQFGTEDDATFTAPSKMWVKSPLKETELPLKYGNTVEGIGKSQVFFRYAQFEAPFLIGTIHYHSFPYSKNPENDTPEAVKKAFMKMHKLKWVGEWKIENHTWVFQGPQRQGGRFYRLYFTKGKKSYAVSTSVLRNAYLETTEVEAQWIQNKIMQRHLEQEQAVKTTRFNLDNFEWSIFPTAHAQTTLPCPPPTASGAPPIGACPTASTCAGLFPTAQATCLANIANCQQGNLTTMFNTANGTIGGLRQDINCESNKWGTKVDNLQTWMDQKIAGQEPRVDRFLGQVDRAIDVVDRLTDPVHMAGVAALGAMASTLATGAIGLAVQGIGEGLSYLYREISGQNEEELMRLRADAFGKAKDDWEKLNGELGKVEESIDTSMELLEVVKASGLGLEDFLKSVRDESQKKSRESSRLRFQIDRMQREYERTDNEQTLQCLIATDVLKKAADAELTRLGVLGDQLDKFKKKNNNFEFACTAMSREIGTLLAKEAVIEKARSNMGLYFAAHLWVEQKDAAKKSRDQQELVPMENFRREKEAAQMEFYNRLFPPVIDTNREERVNCKRVLLKIAQDCSDQNKKWYDYLPFSPTNLGQIRKCGMPGISAHANPSVESGPMRSIEPQYYSYLLGTYAKNLVATGAIYNKVEGPFEAKCVRLAVDNYASFTARSEQARANYSVDLATWNHRLVSFNSYYKETSDMINNIKIESACGTIAETGCYEGEADCERLRKDSCFKNVKRTSCAQHEVGDCPAPSAACRNQNDPSDYCRYQRERIGKCYNFERECTASDYPMGCEPFMDKECRKHCEDILLRCKDFRAQGFASFEVCNTRLAPQVESCAREEKSCFATKSKCVKSSFSNARFRFERFKTMKKYLDENLCQNFPRSRAIGSR